MWNAKLNCREKITAQRFDPHTHNTSPRRTQRREGVRMWQHRATHVHRAGMHTAPRSSLRRRRSSRQRGCCPLRSRSARETHTTSVESVDSAQWPHRTIKSSRRAPWYTTTLQMYTTLHPQTHTVTHTHPPTQTHRQTQGRGCQRPRATLTLDPTAIALAATPSSPARRRK